MTPDQVAEILRQLLREAMIVAAPILLAAALLSFLLSLLQTLTSLQDNTISTVSRLLITGGAIFLMMPWMWRHLVNYTIVTLSDFHEYLR